MKHTFFREPIHMNIQTKGKLRRGEPLKYYSNSKQHQDFSDLIVIPSLFKTEDIKKIISSKRNSKLRANFFYRRNIENDRELQYNSKTVDDESRYHPHDTGSFRAIHTATHFDTLKGFPLRSITPIRPFRRGIKTGHKLDKETINLESLLNEKPSKKISVQSPESYVFPQKSQAQTALIQLPQFIPKYDDEIEYEQFFKYKDKNPQSAAKKLEDNIQTTQGKLTGTKITPFKKYQIRQIQKVIYDKNRIFPRNSQKIHSPSVFQERNLQK